MYGFTLGIHHHSSWTISFDLVLWVLAHACYEAHVTNCRTQDNPQVLEVTEDAQNRGEKLLRFLGTLAVNGPGACLSHKFVSVIEGVSVEVSE